MKNHDTDFLDYAGDYEGLRTCNAISRVNNNNSQQETESRDLLFNASLTPKHQNSDSKMAETYLNFKHMMNKNEKKIHVKKKTCCLIL
jgi:hypothetical protein